MICVDASVAVKWILAEEHSDRALALVEEADLNREVLVAPPLLPIEVTNTIWQQERRQAMDLTEAERLLDQFLAFPVTLVAPVGLHHDALSLADAYGLPAVYDAHYLALAQRLGCPLWTDDRRLLRLVGDALPFVRPIAAFAP